MKVTYRIIEIVHFKKPLGIYTVREELKLDTGLEVSSKIYESLNIDDCKKYVSIIKQLDKLNPRDDDSVFRSLH